MLFFSQNFALLDQNLSDFRKKIAQIIRLVTKPFGKHSIKIVNEKLGDDEKTCVSA